LVAVVPSELLHVCPFLCFQANTAANLVLDVKNPIGLAHIVLKESFKPLSLARVPPNLIVGDGAADFASEHGHSIVPNDILVSEVAHDRWLKWKNDLELDARRSAKRRRGRADVGEHTASPPQMPNEPTNLSSIPTPPRPFTASAVDLPIEALHAQAGHTPHAKRFYTPLKHATVHSDFDEKDDEEDDGHSATDAEMQWEMSPPPPQSRANRSFDGSSDDHGADLQDNIIDTVGAIAIDGWGNIAAGSSSGGIGMKHKGRCGPAALNGIGTAVIPREEKDEDEVSVAAVVSGTGEHMSTTLAASTAANRVYFAHKKKGLIFQECSEDEALHDMIAEDFLGHPSVRTSPCPGAIGVLAVKKMKSGIYFYFAHNTDSFALASMHSDEKKPVCVMSRNKGSGGIAQGGRLSRNRYARRSP
jgi:taspase, threonine aspartase, 1